MKKLIKPNLATILFVLFFIISVLLSFRLKVVEENYTKLCRQKNYELSYRLDMLSQTFEDNFNIAGKKLFENKSHYFFDKSNNFQNISILYLKEDACSECYNLTIKEILKNLGNSKHFNIVSHPSNKVFLNQMIRLDILPPAKNITYTEKEIYDSGYSPSSADLLVLNNDLSVKFFLPLDFLNEYYFFEKYILFLESRLSDN